MNIRTPERATHARLSPITQHLSTRQDCRQVRTQGGREEDGPGAWGSRPWGGGGRSMGPPVFRSAFLRCQGRPPIPGRVALAGEVGALHLIDPGDLIWAIGGRVGPGDIPPKHRADEHRPCRWATFRLELRL